MGKREAILTEKLSLQRQRWLLQNIRQHEHDTIMEIGCGEGSLMQALCTTPPWIDASKEYRLWLESITHKPLRSLIPKQFISPTLLIGVDVDHAPLQIARTHLEQADALCLISDPLEVKLLHCDFRHLPVQEYEDIDVIAASEVIEHLEEDVLAAFCPTLLGQMQPRVLLLTTPNYAFNVHFDHSTGGFPDPTGRTKRVFRHHDHKFEWTPDEFKAWCTRWAAKFGYMVTVDGVGRNEGYDGGSIGDYAFEDSMLASQTAVFVRKQSASKRAASQPSTIAIDQHLDAVIPLYRRGMLDMTAADDEGDEFSLMIVLDRLFDDTSSNKPKRRTLEEIWNDQDVKESCEYRLDLLLAWVTKLKVKQDVDVNEDAFYLAVTDDGIVHLCMT